MEKVGFKKRFYSMGIDFGLIVVACLVFDLGYRLFLKEAAPGAGSGLGPGDLVAFLAAVTVYASIEGLIGQSPGKMMNHIINRNPEGAPAEITALLFRSLLKYSIFLVPLIIAGTIVFMHSPTPALVTRYTQSLIGLIMIQLVVFIALTSGIVMFNGCFLVLTENRLALHDRLADTAVFPINVNTKQRRMDY